MATFFFPAANVLVENGVAKITDFGLSKLFVSSDDSGNMELTSQVQSHVSQV